MTKVAERNTLYECENPACSQGIVGHPSQFTGGISAAQATMLTGNPEPDHGEGYCPSCGKLGSEVGVHEVLEPGEDEHADAHAEIAALVEEGKLPAEFAQAAFLELVGEGPTFGGKPSVSGVAEVEKGGDE